MTARRSRIPPFKHLAWAALIAYSSSSSRRRRGGAAGGSSGSERMPLKGLQSLRPGSCFPLTSWTRPSA